VLAKKKSNITKVRKYQRESGGNHSNFDRENINIFEEKPRQKNKHKNNNKCNSKIMEERE